MNLRRAARIWTAIAMHAERDGDGVTLANACLSCMDMVGVTGVSLALTNGASVIEPVFASDDRAVRIEELQATVGEGPGVTALESGLPVTITDMSMPEVSARWPVFASEVDDLGVNAMFGIPLRVGAVVVGVLDLYRDSVGGLTAGQLADAQIYADFALAFALDSLSGVQASGDVTDGEHQLELWHAEVHQAAGMASAQLGIPVFEALVRLRAHAYSRRSRLTEVARAVVDRRLRFDPDEDTTTNNREGAS